MQQYLQHHPFVMVALIPVIIWTLIWKGLALWTAARKSDKIWFVVLLIVNTFGILEMLYFFFFSRKKADEANFKV